MSESFEQWFASYLEKDEIQVARLLNDKTAIRFLIAWSIFESDCFEGCLKVTKFDNCIKEVLRGSDFDIKNFAEVLAHFHKRYQDKKLYKNLMHTEKSDKLESIIGTKIDLLKPDEVIFFLVSVVRRYRNNIFHGNKGVESWLQFRCQIDYCIRVMQILIDLAKKSHNKALNFN